MNNECTQLREWLPALVDDPAPSSSEDEALTRLRAHSEHCAACQQELTDLREFRTLIQGALAYLPSEEEQREIARLTSESGSRFLTVIRSNWQREDASNPPNWIRLLEMRGRERRRLLRDAVARVIEHLQFPDRSQFPELWKTGMALSATRSSSRELAEQGIPTSPQPKSTVELVSLALELDDALERGIIPDLLASDQELDPPSVALRTALRTALSQSGE